jgi:hypothetical protein
MTTSYSKLKGRSKGYRYANSIVDLQRDLWKRNAKKTPKELGADERFEDVIKFEKVKGFSGMVK